MNSLLFLAYGSKEVKQQTLFSICSALFNANYKSLSPLTNKIVVYTDDIAYFQSFFGVIPLVEYRAIDALQIKEWRGAIDFVHRVKLQILKDYFKQNTGKLIYSDGDTLFLSSFVELFSTISKDCSLMHCLEGRLDEDYNTVCKKIRKFVEGKKWSLNGTQVEISPSVQMWNAGVIGISDFLSFSIDGMIELTDQLYSRYQKHVMEQLSVSYLLQTQTSVVGVQEEVFHYYFAKEKMLVLSRELLKRYPSVDALESAWSDVQAELLSELSAPVLKKKGWLSFLR